MQTAVLILCLVFTGASAWALTGKKYQVVIGGRHFSVEVAITRRDRQRGLMGREQLGRQGGLLIILPETGYAAIWMKNMKIPLDVIWVEENGLVSDFQTLLPCTKDPCQTFRPKSEAKYILEIGRGNFQGKIGDIIAIFDASGDSLLP